MPDHCFSSSISEAFLFSLIGHHTFSLEGLDLILHNLLWKFMSFNLVLLAWPQLYTRYYGLQSSKKSTSLCRGNYHWHLGSSLFLFLFSFLNKFNETPYVSMYTVTIYVIFVLLFVLSIPRRIIIILHSTISFRQMCLMDLQVYGLLHVVNLHLISQKHQPLYMWFSCRSMEILVPMMLSLLWPVGHLDPLGYLPWTIMRPCIFRHALMW